MIKLEKQIDIQEYENEIDLAYQEFCEMMKEMEKIETNIYKKKQTYEKIKAQYHTRPKTLNALVVTSP